MNDKKALGWFKQYTMNNKRFKANFDRNTTEIVVLLREKHKDNLGNKLLKLNLFLFKRLQQYVF